MNLRKKFQYDSLTGFQGVLTQSSQKLTLKHIYKIRK